MKKYTEQLLTAFAVLSILFWLLAAGLQLYDIEKFKGEMYNQVFSSQTSSLLSYLVPAVEVTISALLVFSAPRFIGMTLSFLLMLSFTAYVGLALMHVYSRMPCNCAGLLGSNSSWGANFLLNLVITLFFLAALIFSYKYKEKERKVSASDAGPHDNKLTIA